MSKAEKRVITMSDGREVSFGKSAKVLKEIVSADGIPTGIRFDGDNGDTFLARFDELPHWDWIQLATPDSVEVWALAHGLNQKLGDSYASIDATADCLETVRMVWARLTSNQWNSESRGFGASAVLLEACIRAFGKSKDETRAILSGMTKAERDTLQISPGVKEHYDAIMQERAKGDVSGLIAKFQ